MPNFRVATKHVTFTRRLPGCRIPNLTMHPCMREQPSRYKATDGFLDACQVDRRRDAREWRCSMDFWIQFPWTPTKLNSAIFTLLALPRCVTQLFLAGAAVVCHALVHAVRLCSAPPRCRRRLLAARPPCAAGEDEGTEKTASIFGAILSPRVRVARSARRRLKTTAPHNAKPTVESVWEHERSPSSHDTTALLSLLILL